MPSAKINKPMTLRVAPEQKLFLEVAARVEGISENEMVGNALEFYIELKRKDPVFKERLRQYQEEQVSIYEKMARAS